MIDKQGLLFILPSYPQVGGVEIVTKNLISYFKNHFSVYVLAFWGNTDKEYLADQEGNVNYFFSPNDLEKNIEFYNRFILENRVSIVINQGILPCFRPIVFNDKRNRDVYIFSSLHGMPKYEESLYWLNPEHEEMSRRALSQKKERVRKGCEKSYNEYISMYQNSYMEALEEGDGVVLLCEAYKRSFLEKYNAWKYKEKIFVISNPLKRNNRHIVPFEKKENVLLCLGRLSSEKRIDHILRVWAMVQDHVDWIIKIVGEGDDQVRLEALATQLKLKKIIFCGQTNNPELFYQQSKIIIMTSLYEGLPMTLLEAQSYGVIPICYRISAGVESIIKKGNGIIVKNNCPKILALKLFWLMKNVSLQKRLYTNVIFTSNNYSIDNIGEQWLNLFQVTKKKKIF